MTIALWCVLAAGLIHLPFAMGAKWSRRFDNARPRAYFDALSGWRQRSHWAQLNTLEVFPLFAAGVIVCHLVAGSNATADQLALGFVASRVAFGLLYIANRATLRSVVWLIGMACTIGLFVVAARV